MTKLSEISHGDLASRESRRKTASSLFGDAAGGSLPASSGPRTVSPSRANHTLHWDDDIEVLTADGSSGRGEVLGRDPSTDVALLRVSGLELEEPSWRPAETATAGELAVVVAASPMGPRVLLTSFSVVSEAFTASGGGRIPRYLETALPLFPGLSGSPLLDPSGGLHGMCTTGLARRAPLLVPAETLGSVVESLREHGAIPRGFLGVTTIPVRLPEAGARQGVGLLILSVQPESPAARAGLFLGDVLLSFEGNAIDSPLDLLSRLTEERIGTKVPIEILRAGSERRLDVEIAARR